MNNLKELRKEKEKSIREVAETIKLANYYDTSIDYLLGRKDWY